MNVKERIEKIKRKHVFETGNEQDFIRAADIVWLLKMAEVNEKWSGQLSELNKFLKGRADDIQEGHQLIYVAMELIRRLEKENEQHKQALEFGVKYLQNSNIRQIQLVVSALKKALEETE